MNSKLMSAILIGLCLLANSISALAQKKPETISTLPKLVLTKLKVGEGEVYDVKGKATFTLTAANSDDSVTGTITYTLPEDARQKIAQITGKPLSAIPTSITQKDVVADFQKATACPVVHLEFAAMTTDVAGAQLHFNRFVLDINETQPTANNEQKELVQLFCVWTRQINNGRARRGVIATINRILNGEEQ
jgi:hypothetical protein